MENLISPITPDPIEAVVVPDTTKPTTSRKVTTQNVEQIYMESIVRTTELYSTLVKSIKKKDLEELNTKDKISALSKLADINKQMRTFKPNAGVFNQINVFGAQREDLEKAILDFTPKP
jgi:hypothetical protein